jgi:hypothetical protein
VVRGVNVSREKKFPRIKQVIFFAPSHPKSLLMSSATITEHTMLKLSLSAIRGKKQNVCENKRFQQTVVSRTNSDRERVPVRTHLSACHLGSVARNEVVHRLSAGEPGHWGQHSERITAQQDDVLRVRPNARDFGVLDMLHWVRGTGVLGDGNVIIIDLHKRPIQSHKMVVGHPIHGVQMMRESRSHCSHVTFETMRASRTSEQHSSNCMTVVCSNTVTYVLMHATHWGGY